MIESQSNVQIKYLQKLIKNPRFRRKEKCFVVEGWKMVGEALRHHLVSKLYISADSAGQLREKVTEDEFAVIESGVPTELLSENLFREMSDTVSPQGILALVRMPEYQRSDFMKSGQAAVLCLENIQDPGNLGTMLRTAEGAGMSGIIMSSDCVDLFNPKVVRSTMGALFRVPYYICEDMTTEVERLKKEDYSVYAAHLKGTKDYTEENYSGRVAVLIGNEANGLSDSVAGRADKKVIIPMEGELESLNAAVSAALLMYEIHRKKHA